MNKNHLGGGIDSDGTANGSEAQVINAAVTQGLEGYANVVSVQDSNGLHVVVLG